MVKVHEQQGKVLVAVCDSELLGKTFSEDDQQIDLTSNFYKGEEKSEEEIGDLLRNADAVNLVGTKSINIGIREGIIDEEHIARIENIPHAQGSIIRD